MLWNASAVRVNFKEQQCHQLEMDPSFQSVSKQFMSGIHSLVEDFTWIQTTQNLGLLSLHIHLLSLLVLNR